MLGTRRALHEKGRESITVILDELNAHRIGALIAVYERAVGLYASLVHINAYHQPGVEAGKKTAASFLQLKKSIRDFLRERPNHAYTAEQLAGALDRKTDTEIIFKLLEHLAANRCRGVHHHNPG